MLRAKSVQFTPPAFEVPAGACDCHMHVFADRTKYPMVPRRSYTPSPAPLKDYLLVARRLGIERAVFVQPSVYGSDNRCMLDAMRRFSSNARGVAVVDRGATAKELEALNSAGVRGLRLNAASFGYNSKDGIEHEMNRLTEIAASFGWHLQLFAGLATIHHLAPAIVRSPVPVIIDHMGLAKAKRGLEQPGFPSLLELLADGSCWVKVSGADRISVHDADFSDSILIAKALVAANSSRIVWGSDWPHTPAHAGRPDFDPDFAQFRPIDDGMLLNLLAVSAGDAAILRGILVDNPALLYGF